MFRGYVSTGIEGNVVGLYWQHFYILLLDNTYLGNVLSE